MKKRTLIIAVFLIYTAGLFAQTANTSSYQMFNTQMMKPKRGHEKQFEDAVKAHVAKFHPKGAYDARLSVITDGSGSDGWYLWSMGPLTYTDMDKTPAGTAGHDEDWDKTVDTHVETYGESNFWKLREDQSYTPANYRPERVDVWLIDMKAGMGYTFSDLMKKWKAVWDAKKYPYSFRVLSNDLFSKKGNDVAIVFSFTKYADFDLDISWRKDYEAMYGAGSWDNFWKVWNECVESTDEQLRKYIN